MTSRNFIVTIVAYALLLLPSCRRVELAQTMDVPIVQTQQVRSRIQSGEFGRSLLELQNKLREQSDQFVLYRGTNSQAFVRYTDDQLKTFDIFREFGSTVTDAIYYVAPADNRSSGLALQAVVKMGKVGLSILEVDSSMIREGENLKNRRDWGPAILNYPILQT